ncbi:MAG: prephenate dehydratase [Erysipelotrichaceae bacterium]|nr:prephenate dehydratase [Erysipelotrichaceae bacterium]
MAQVTNQTVEQIDAQIKALLKRRADLLKQNHEDDSINNVALINAFQETTHKVRDEKHWRDHFERYHEALHNAQQVVEKPCVVYQGAPGAYSEMACMKFFGPDSFAIGLHRFDDAFEALANNGADYAVLPIENSSTGAIRQIYDLLSQYDCYIVGETTVKVSHNLMALPGTKLEDIKTVYSHEQGLFQCEKFLRQYDWLGIAKGDTAGSAKMVADFKDHHKAAIASSRAAEIYGLEILVPNINTNSHNTTRFVVIAPRMELRPNRDKICISITTANEVGALHEILSIFALYGLNLTRIESRPIPERNWEYMFFIEFTGDLLGEGMDEVMKELTQSVNDIRVFGNFESNLD